MHKAGEGRKRHRDDGDGRLGEQELRAEGSRPIKYANFNSVNSTYFSRLVEIQN